MWFSRALFIDIVSDGRDWSEKREGEEMLAKRIRRVQGLFPIRAQQLQHNRGGVLNELHYFLSLRLLYS